MTATKSQIEADFIILLIFLLSACFPSVMEPVFDSVSKKMCADTLSDSGTGTIPGIYENSHIKSRYTYLPCRSLNNFTGSQHHILDSEKPTTNTAEVTKASV